MVEIDQLSISKVVEVIRSWKFHPLDKWNWIVASFLILAPVMKYKRLSFNDVTSRHMPYLDKRKGLQSSLWYPEKWVPQSVKPFAPMTQFNQSHQLLSYFFVRLPRLILRRSLHTYLRQHKQTWKYFCWDFWDRFSFEKILGGNTSVIRQKCESQNGCFKKPKHAKFSEKQKFFTPWYTHVRTHTYQEVRNFSFSEYLAGFVILKHPYWDSPFSLITDE